MAVGVYLAPHEASAERRCSPKQTRAMKIYLISVATAFILFTSSVLSAQSNDPVQVVQTQLEAYNAGDIDAFMAVFHPDAQVWRLGGEKPFASGAIEVRTLYAALFEKSPGLHSTVINRSVIGNKVIDYERIVGRLDSDEPLYLVMVYEIVDGKIFRAYSISE